MQNHRYTTLSITEPRDLMFGKSPKSITCGFELSIGAGEVYPEINFTLPMMSIDERTWPEVLAHYEEIGTMIENSSKRLGLPGLMVEFELLPQMTEHPEWGAEITGILHRHLAQAHDEYGLKAALRVTITDIRDNVRPPILRSGNAWEEMLRSLELCADAGADIFSIESVGGKEVNDKAMLDGDLQGVVFALGVLAPRDMAFLWDNISRVAAAKGVISGGDSACGFANTAMQLAGQHMLPEVFAAVVRAASAVRSLVAFEHGAIGPSKDCAYEGPILKAITGCPISMEGKSATCAHFSPIGNVSAAMCDLWSNESVQNIRLLSGMAPEAYLELLTYDCRLFNQALKTRNERALQKLLVDSDAYLSPQALVLTPESTIRIAKAIVEGGNDYRRTVGAAREAWQILDEAARGGKLKLSPQERRWMERMKGELDLLPKDEEEFIRSMGQTYRELFLPESYGLPVVP
ncbi:MAG: methyltransferase MtaB domain-containing protein [Bacteroidota bacterium]